MTPNNKFDVNSLKFFLLKTARTITTSVTIVLFQSSVLNTGCYPSCTYKKYNIQLFCLPLCLRAPVTMFYLGGEKSSYYKHTLQTLELSVMQLVLSLN